MEDKVIVTAELKIMVDAATLAALRYIFQEDMLTWSAYEVQEQLEDYVRSLYPDFSAQLVTAIALRAMEKAIAQ